MEVTKILRLGCLGKQALESKDTADTSACNFPSLAIINAWAEKSTNIGNDVDMILNKVEVKGYPFKSNSDTVFASPDRAADKRRY